MGFPENVYIYFGYKNIIITDISKNKFYSMVDNIMNSFIFNELFMIWTMQVEKERKLAIAKPNNWNSVEHNHTNMFILFSTYVSWPG